MIEKNNTIMADIVNNKIEEMDISKIKLIIWDLDDSFWNGTLSEGPVQLKDELCSLVKYLVDRGIMNSICSKNDFDKVKSILQPVGLWDYFVFPSIDWTPKAPRIADIIKTMALRPVNVLFIDDNIVNLNEAKYYLPELNVLDIKDINLVLDNCIGVGKDDSSHKRLKQYHVLEKKVSERKSFHSTNDFLLQSEIQVTFNKECIPIVDRIVEMINRTNQLNFTKLRYTKEEVISILNNNYYDCSTISVKDKYGDYGIVGFYALNKSNNTLLHFLFSCRTLGMGIEQYVYEELGFPILNIVGEVANKVDAKKVTSWVNINSTKDETPENDKNTSDNYKQFKVLLKGPCDMNSVLPYIKNQKTIDLQTEFNYVNDKGVAITAMNNSVHIVESLTLSLEEKKKLLADVPFMDMGVFETKLINGQWDFVFLSMLPDCHEGVYRHKVSGNCITFSSFNYDLTNKKTWDKFISGEYTNHNFRFTTENLQQFSERFTFEGSLSPSHIVENVKFIRNNILNRKTKLILVMGSEIECESQKTKEFECHAINHQKVNKALREAFADTDNVDFLNITDLIKSQSDFNGCTNHFCRQIYYKMAIKIHEYIQNHGGYDFAIENKVVFRLKSLAIKIRNLLRKSK